MHNADLGFFIFSAEFAVRVPFGFLAAFNDQVVCFKPFDIPFIRYLLAECSHGDHQLRQILHSFDQCDFK